MLKTKEIKKIVKIVKMVEVVKMNKVIKGPEKAVDSRRGQQRATRRWLQTWVKIETEQCSVSMTSVVSCCVLKLGW